MKNREIRHHCYIPDVKAYLYLTNAISSVPVGVISINESVVDVQLVVMVYRVWNPGNEQLRVSR